MLGPYRIVDMTCAGASLCGRLLADLGADVIRVEPPGGHPDRNVGPFYKDVKDPEKSLYWFACNANKRGVTLDIEKEEGRQLFLQLVRTATAVIESFPVGYLASLGLDYAGLAQSKPDIIVASITAFGQEGPYAGYNASDLVCWAMGGMLYLSGDRDRPPVEIGFPQAYFNGAAEAAVGTVTAIYHHTITGEGQHVDVSTQQAVVLCQLGSQRTWECYHVSPRRSGAERYRAGTGAYQRLVWPCKDGYISWLLRGGPFDGVRNKVLVDWMASEGLADDLLLALDWAEFDWETVGPEYARLVQDSIGRFFLAHTKVELYQGARERDLILAPVSSVKDIMEDRQLQARNFWVKVHHEELGEEIIYPGPFFIPPGAECKVRRAPFIGEHNRDIYCGELGLSENELACLKKACIV